MKSISKFQRIPIHLKREIFKRKRKSSENTFKWGIMGLGAMGESFTRALKCVETAEVIAVSSRTTEKANAFAKKHKISSSYGSYEEMILDDNLKLDIVYIATPVKYHYEHIKLCLQNGHNVICEKPITFKHSELEELIELAREKRLFLMEGMWMKCLPTYQKGLEWVNEGRIGEVQWIRADLSKNENMNNSSKKFLKEVEDGVLMDYGIYVLTFPLNFMGEAPPSIVSYEKRLKDDGVDKDWIINLESSKSKAFLSISSNYDGDKKAVLIGTKGTIEWQPQFNRTNCIKLFDENGNLVQKFTESYLYDGFEYEIDEVHKSLLEKRIESDLVPLKDSLLALSLVDQLRNNSSH